MTGADITRRFLDSKRAAHCSPDTIEWYQKHLRSLFLVTAGQMPTVDDLETWIGSAASAEYGRGRLRAARAFLRWCATRGHVDDGFVARAFGQGPHAPPALIQKPRGKANPPRVFSDAELIAIYTEAQRIPEFAGNQHARLVAHQNTAIVTTLVDTGIRVGELASLTTGSLREGAELLVRGKTGPRIVPASPETIRALMVIARPDPRSALFPNHRGSAVTSRVMQNRVRELLARCGIHPPKSGPHTFRHTFATNYLRNGGNVADLQAILGHSSITTTSRYLHLAQADLVEKHRRFTPLNGLMRANQWRLAWETDHNKEDTG